MGRHQDSMDGKKGERVELVPGGKARRRGKPPREHKKGRETSRAERRQARRKVMGRKKGKRRANQARGRYRPATVGDYMWAGGAEEQPVGATTVSEKAGSGNRDRT